MGQDHDKGTRQASSSVLTLDSVFDIKGPLRLVSQGAPQKPHIVLRREPSSQNAAESSSLAGTARFSLVANKRFTISKGHTLSLGIANPSSDDEVKLLNPDGSFLLEFDIGNKPQAVDNLSSLPARMRKSLTGTKTFDAFAHRLGPNSLGFPGYPLSIPQTRLFASASVQTDPVAPVELPVSSRTPTPTSLKPHKRKSPLRLYPSPISVDDQSLDDAPVVALAQAGSDGDARTERSFSSMDLSTPSQSLSNSPVTRSLSRPGNDSPLTPEPPDDDYFSIPPAVPEVRTSLDGSGMCDVSKAVKPNELKPTDPNSCSIIPVHASTSHLTEKETSQPVIDKPSTPLPQTTPSSANLIHDLDTNTGNTEIPKMPRAMSGIPKALSQTKPLLSTPTPQPTISNPLGIRPSKSKRVPIGPRSIFGNMMCQPRDVQATTPTLAPTAAPRKPVVVGAKWTALRGLSSSASSQANASNAASATATTFSSSSNTALTTTSANKNTTPDLSQLLRYSVSPPHRDTPATIPSTGKRKLILENEVLDDQGPLKRVRSENGGGDKKLESKGLRIRGIAEELKKKVKTENVEVTAQPSASAGLSRVTNPPTLLARVDSTSVDGGDSAVDGSALMSKSRRRRERKKLSKQRKSGLELTEGVQEDDKDAMEAKERLRLEEEEKMKKEKERAKAEEREKHEKAVKLAQEKADVDNQKLAAAETATAPILPAHKHPQRFLHPLPPKPRVLTYRPGRKKGRSRTSSKSRDSLSRSRSRSQGRETPPAWRARNSTRSRSRSRSRKRDWSVDRQPQDNRTKPSAPDSNADNAHGGVAQSKQEERTPNEARVPGTKSVPPQPRAIVNGDLWPTTNPSRETPVVGWNGITPVPVQHLVFSSDGKMLAMIADDSSIRIWETVPQAREIRQWKTHLKIQAISWHPFDTGVVVLLVDGTTELFSFEDKWLEHFCSSYERAYAFAYGKDKIAISTTASVKVWSLTPKGVWQPQREIKRSGVTALRFKHDGSGLFGGCRDGTLWYSEVPNGTLRAYAFLPSNKCITSIHLHPNGTQLLIGQMGGAAYLISHQPMENKGTLEKKYCPKVDDETEGNLGAIFATGGQAVVSGISKGCVLVWDRKKGNMVYGLKHRIDDEILAIAAFDGRPGVEGMMVTGTENGRLCWWPIPKAAIR